jgi:peroxiredoxin Q/BCP
MRWTHILAAFWVAASLAAFGVPGAQAQSLSVGDQAPPFELPGSDGQTHSLADYAGKTVVLSWFPKAFTGG